MTEASDLRTLKTLAKRYARANRIAQHQALDLVAGQLGFANWVKLASASKGGWQASGDQVANVEAFINLPIAASTILDGDPEAMRRRLVYLHEGQDGQIGGHTYQIQVVLGDVMMTGEGWSIRVPENPSASPIIEAYVPRSSSCPVFDPEFVEKAVAVARERATQVVAEIATDWPRRSTKPDLHGVVRHPLGRGESAVWFCYHCDSKITGAQVAHNLWHCPGCGASPLDIFEVAFWASDEGKSFAQVQTPADDSRPTPEAVDGRPKLELTPEKIALLIRSALLDDAANVSEQLGALHADISVDDEHDVWIVLDVYLWPEEKDPVQALAVAELLGIEVDLAVTMFTIPFAWPDIGKFASSTREYTEMMLDAYDQYDGLPEKKPKAT